MTSRIASALTSGTSWVVTALAWLTSASRVQPAAVRASIAKDRGPQLTRGVTVTEPIAAGLPYSIVSVSGSAAVGASAGVVPPLTQNVAGLPSTARSGGNAGCELEAVAIGDRGTPPS